LNSGVVAGAGVAGFPMQQGQLVGKLLLLGARLAAEGLEMKTWKHWRRIFHGVLRHF
jgi:hypothetical protein